MIVLLVNKKIVRMNFSLRFELIQRKNMTETPEKETFLRFPKPDEESQSDKWHLLGTRVPQPEIV